MTHGAGVPHFLCVLGQDLVQQLLSLSEFPNLVDWDAVTLAQSR